VLSATQELTRILFRDLGEEGGSPASGSSQPGTARNSGGQLSFGVLLVLVVVALIIAGVLTVPWLGRKGGVFRMNLKDSKIVQRWSAMLPNCQGEGPGLTKSVQETLASYEVPGLSWKEESASTGFLKGMMGKRRDVLVVRNEQFSEWLVCVGAQDYGRFLYVTWYLTTSPKLLNKVRSVAAGDVLVDELDVFDQQDVEAFASVTRMAVRVATDHLAEKHQIDLERLERQARGLRANG